MILLTLPMSPTVNNAYGINTRTGAPYLKTAQKEYREIVQNIVRENGWNFQANIPIKVMIVMNFGNKRRNDLDNRLKALFDACTHAKVWEDDSLIDDLHVARGLTSGEPSIMMQVQAMEDALVEY